MTKLRLLTAFLACLTLLGTATAHADDVLEGSPVVRRNLQFRASRHEIGAVFGTTLGDPYVRNLLPGVRYDLHLRDWIAVGADLLVGIPVQTSFSGDVENKVLKFSNETFEMETTYLRYLAQARIEVAPLIGKFMAFSSLPVQFDAHVQLTAGLAGVSGTAHIPSSNSLAPGVGGGVRVFVSRVLALTAEINDVFISRTLAVDRNSKAPTPQFIGHPIFTAGLSFFVPPDLKRAE